MTQQSMQAIVIPGQHDPNQQSMRLELFDEGGNPLDLGGGGPVPFSLSASDFAIPIRPAGWEVLHEPAPDIIEFDPDGYSWVATEDVMVDGLFFFQATPDGSGSSFEVNCSGSWPTGGSDFLELGANTDSVGLERPYKIRLLEGESMYFMLSGFDVTEQAYTYGLIHRLG